MSGRKKRLRRQVIDQMLTGAISVPEARARMAWVKTGAYQPPRATAVKSAGPVTGYERYYAHPDPQVREWARAAAEQGLVTKSLRPGRAAAVPRPGGARAAVWGPGPDGRMGWRVPQAEGPYGVRIAPDGIAGR